MSGTSVKLVILGDASVGKTSLIQRYICGRNDIQNSTLGAVFVQLRHSFKNNEGKLIEFPIQCWDTAGQERYHALIPMYVRDADYIIIAFDLSNMLTFMKLDTWIKLCENSVNKTKYVLVGCKNDINPNIPIKEKDINNFINENIPSARYFSTSSLTGNNVKELFKHIKKELEEIGQRRKLLNGKLTNSIIKVSNETTENFYSNLSGRLNKCCF